MTPNSADTYVQPMPEYFDTPTSTEWAIGLDLSLTGSGIAIISEDGIRTALITSSGARTDTLRDRWERQNRIVQQVCRFLYEGPLVVIEQPAYSQTAGSQHDRSGLWWRIVNHAHELTDVVEVAPTTLKKYATGKGNASKDEMLAAAIHRYPAADVTNNNVADAVHLAAMGARFMGHPQEADTVKIAEAMTVPKWVA